MCAASGESAPEKWVPGGLLRQLLRSGRGRTCGERSPHAPGRWDPRTTRRLSNGREMVSELAVAGVAAGYESMGGRAAQLGQLLLEGATEEPGGADRVAVGPATRLPHHLVDDAEGVQVAGGESEECGAAGDGRRRAFPEEDRGA